MKNFIKALIAELYSLIRSLILVPKINKALNIRLYNWQINYIFFNIEIPSDILNKRATGKTTARILKILFSKGNLLFIPSRATYNPITNAFDFHYRDRFYRSRDYSELKKFVDSDMKYYRAFLLELKAVYQKLGERGFKMREIFFER